MSGWSLGYLLVHVIEEGAGLAARSPSVEEYVSYICSCSRCGGLWRLFGNAVVCKRMLSSCEGCLGADTDVDTWVAAAQ